MRKEGTVFVCIAGKFNIREELTCESDKKEICEAFVGWPIEDINFRIGSINISNKVGS
jgi:hypothetical protein